MRRQIIKLICFMDIATSSWQIIDKYNISVMKKYGKVLVALGMQWGDEGKGKIIDILAPKYDLVIRANGGANAGHTIKFNKDGAEKKIVFHQIPSGMTNNHSICVIGNGCVVDFQGLEKEIQDFEALGLGIDGRLKISDRAHMVMGYHKEIDAVLEKIKGKNKIGTTLRGIGPAYADKIFRHNLRVGDLKNWDGFVEAYEKARSIISRIWGLKVYNWQAELAYFQKIRAEFFNNIINSYQYINNAIDSGKSILLEGANGTMLDIDHGTYPFVTSSNVIVSGLCSGSGITPKKVTDVLGILKAYTTRVGAGPFPTELEDEIGENMQKIGQEFGSTTGRGRRCGWFDAIIAKYSCNLNGITAINLTKLDVLAGFEEMKICTGYILNGEKIDYIPSSIADLMNLEPVYEKLPGWKQEITGFKDYKDLPQNCRNYIERIEELLKTPIDIINTGPHRDQVIFK